MSKHTPGPWLVKGTFVSTFITREDNATIATLPSLRYADKEQEKAVAANARLISAAPDLLDAAKVARSILSNFGASDPEHALRLEYLQLEEAIAKAEGRE